MTPTAIFTKRRNLILIKKMISWSCTRTASFLFFIQYLVDCPGAWGKLKHQTRQENWRSFFNYMELKILYEKERTHTHE